MKNTVCVIDDDDISNFITTRLIDKIYPGSSIKCCRNGRVAIDHLRTLFNSKKLLPDYILLDLTMPVMDGWQFLDALDEEMGDLNITSKIIIITNWIRKNSRIPLTKNKNSFF
ncbi:response regulator [Mucilaginibacter conchicola]|uniref:Response regulator n=1 Tax=Mucilaginibacter conchicola TaxID=2303333 RepID=A0A372NQR2_9SPHI|nr:response regulator [Mucilaginibacter conchicola]RFZ91281.1 response regulator [Mucilaginibacter conchicola]